LSSSQFDLPTVNSVPSADEGAEEKIYFSPSLSFLTYSYRENLFGEFERLVDANKTFDGLIIDLVQTGFSLPLEDLVKFSGYAKRLLKQQGVLLFVKNDGAITLTRDDPGGGLTFNAYDSPFGIFARYPMLADYVCATVAGIDRRKLRGGGSTLANHILYTSMPVLTDQGRRVKSQFTLPAPQSWVLSMIDDYSTVESMTRNLEARHQLPADETMRLLQEVEAQGLIFPIFARIQFLANCYHNRKPFRLGRYLVAAGILTEQHLQELLERQQEEGWGKSQKTFLGLLAVRAGYINTRELEVLLDDQYLYGGYHKKADEEGNPGNSRGVNIETMRDSMIGSLGAIDAAGLLQSLSTAKKTGLLTVENREKAFVISYSAGKPMHARMNKLKGPDALTEFLVSWTEGIFVFRDKGTSQELDDQCTLKQSLDKALLDAALFQDNLVKTLSTLPAGRNSILERVWNFETLWTKLTTKPLKYGDESPVKDADKAHMAELATLIDGLSTVDEVIKAFDIWPSHMIIKSIQFFLDQKLLNIQQASLFRPLSIFQRVAAELQKSLGRAENKALLEASLHYVHGASPSAARFNIDQEGRVSLNLNEVKRSGAPVSSVILELRRWMEAYLAYCRRQIDPQLVDNTVARVVNAESTSPQRITKWY
jgi:hypothetical protein